MPDRPNPFDEIERFFEGMNRSFGDVAMPTGGYDMAVDVAETDTEVVVTADVPGFEKDDISIALSERDLAIEADREETVEDDEGDEDVQYHRRERRRQRLSRTVRLPAAVDADSARAEHHNGVVTVVLQRERADEDDSHRIDIE